MGQEKRWVNRCGLFYMVRSNVVGDTEHPLDREVPYQCHGSRSTYFEPLHVQWIPVHRLFVDVVEVQLAQLRVVED